MIKDHICPLINNTEYCRNYTNCPPKILHIKHTGCDMEYTLGNCPKCIPLKELRKQKLNLIKSNYD